MTPSCSERRALSFSCDQFLVSSDEVEMAQKFKICFFRKLFTFMSKVLNIKNLGKSFCLSYEVIFDGRMGQN